MKAKALLAVCGAALVLAACNLGDSTGPGAVQAGAQPRADGNGQAGSGGFTPPPDSTRAGH